ncbi:MAG: T9SS type A sorting domain-containing protein [Bacteroidota bacterium]
MKKLVLSLFIFFTVAGMAQVNLVTNPSFEDTVNCPYQAGDIFKANGWTSLCGSPDFFNTCNQYDWGVPTNICGFQLPASGNAYAGFVTYSNSMTNAREFPACNLSSSLNVGTKYFVSFKVVLSLENVANPANCASNKTGAMFTMGTSICNSLITNNPPVFTDSIITDSLNWTKISGSFVADSAYSNMVIGNFFDDANTDTTKFFNSWWSDFAYYYLDDVCVSTDSLFANNYIYTGIKKNNSSNGISCYPNPIVDNLTIKNLMQEKMDVKIYNILGEQVFFIKDVTDKELTVNLSSIVSGILFVQIKSGKQTNSYKLLKQ